MGIEDYPKPCRDAITRISKKLNTDYETAYAMMTLNALLFDLHPSAPEIEEMILGDAACG